MLRAVLRRHFARKMLSKGRGSALYSVISVGMAFENGVSPGNSSHDAQVLSMPRCSEQLCVGPVRRSRPAAADHPDAVTRQFFDAARCPRHRRDGAARLRRRAIRIPRERRLPGGPSPTPIAVELEDFKARTDRSDGTAVVMKLSGRFVDGERGEMDVSARVRLVRDGGEWCISGEQDGFRAVSGSATDVFSVLVQRWHFGWSWVRCLSWEGPTTIPVEAANASAGRPA